MLKVSDSVYRSDVPSVTLPPYRTTNAYWVGSKGRVLLVDPGDGQAAAIDILRQDWEALGRPVVEGVYCTHYHMDHSGGARAAGDLFHAPFFLSREDQACLAEHGADASGFEVLEAGRVSVGGVDVEVLAAPGHTPGQMNLWLPREGGLLAGDNVLGNTTVVIVPPDGDLGRYLQSLKTLRTLPLVWIGPGHGDLVRDPAGYLGEYIAHREERTRQIRGLLASDWQTPRAIAEQVYRGKLSDGEMVVGEWMVRGHLAWFREQGWVEESDGRYRKVGDHDFS